MGDLQISCFPREPMEVLTVAPPPPPAPSCGIGGNGNFDLTVNKMTRGGTTQMVISCSPFDIVEDVCERCSPQFQAELRHHGEFDNQPKDLSLLDVGISQPMQVDLQISCFPREPMEVLTVAPPPPPAPSCGIGGNGNFDLTVNKMTRGGTTQMV